VMSRRAFSTSSMWLLAASAGATVAGCTSRNKALRYRVTIEVGTPLGLKIGTSVLESVFNSGNRFENSGKAWTNGQAPYVDLGSGRYLFSTLSDPFEKAAMFSLLLKVLRYPETRPPLADPGGSAVDQANGTMPFGVVRRQDYPLLVTFGDVNAPETVKEVDPDDLEESFGTGHWLKSITVQIVDRREPLTGGFEKRFKAIAGFDRPFRKEAAQFPRSADVAGQLQNGYFIHKRL
jgi:hypothetical protein